MIDLWIFNYNTILLSIRITLDKALVKYRFSSKDLSKASFVIAKSLFEKAKNNPSDSTFYRVYDKGNNFLVTYIGQSGIFVARVPRNESRYIPSIIGFFRSLDLNPYIKMAFDIGDVVRVLHVIREKIKENFGRRTIVV